MSDLSKSRCVRVSHEASVVELGGGGGSERSEVSLRPSEARELAPGFFWGGRGGGGHCKPPPPPPNGAGAEHRKILNFSASRTPNIVFPGHLRTKILSFIKRKIGRISITQLLSCIIITNDTYYVRLSVHSLK